MQEFKGKNDKEKEIVQKHIDDVESTHSSAVSDPVWGFLLKLHQRYVTKAGELQEDSASVFRKYLNEKHSPDEAKNKALHAAYSHLNSIMDQPVNRFDVIPEHLIVRIDPELQSKTTVKFDDKTETVMPLITVFSLIYQATMDPACFPKSSSQEQRLLTLCNALEILHQQKPKICHQGVRNDLAHTLNLTFKFPDAEKPVLFLDDIDTALLAWIKQKARDFLKTFSQWSNATYVKLMLQWVKTGETPEEIIKLLNAQHPEKNGTTILRDYIERQLEILYLNPADYKKKLDNFLDSSYLTYLQMPVEAGELYYAVREVFNQPETIKDPLRDQAFSNFKMEVEARLVSGQITPKMESDLIQEMQQFLLIDKAFVLNQTYQSIFIAQSELEVESLDQSCRDFYRKYQSISESKRESKIQSTERSVETAESFITGANRYLQDSQVSWVENFFIMYRSAPNLESSQRLYAKWFSLHELGKVAAPDVWLEKIYLKSEQSGTASVIRISPYEVNRIVLHVLRVSPKKWTSLFAKTYALVLEQLDGEEFEGSLTRQFRDNSYPEDFRAQLRFMNVLRDSHRSVGEAKSQWGPTTETHLLPMTHGAGNNFFGFGSGQTFFFPSTYWAGNHVNYLSSMFTMAQYLNPEQQKQLVEEVGAERIRTIIQTSINLSWVLNNSNPEQQKNFLEALGSEQLRKIIKNHFAITIINYLDIDQTRNALEMLGNEHVSNITGDYEEFLGILLTLKKENHGDFLKTLDHVKLKKIIQNEYQFFRVLKHLDKQQYGNFLQLIGSEHLHAIIGNGVHLSSVLLYSKREKYWELPKILYSDPLIAMVSNKKQLLSVLSHLNAEQRHEIQSAIGFNYDRDDLRTILDCLNLEQSINFLTAISYELHKHIRESLSQLKIEQCEFFFPVYQTYVLGILDKEYGFQFGHWRSHSARMEALKQEIKGLRSIREIYDLLSNELEAYSSQASHKKDPVRSPIPGFSFFKKQDLRQKKEESRYYLAVEKAKTYFGFLKVPPSLTISDKLSVVSTRSLEAKREVEIPQENTLDFDASKPETSSYSMFSSSIREEKKGDPEENVISKSSPEVSSSSAVSIPTPSFFYRPEIQSTSSSSNTTVTHSLLKEGK